jgi:hypothetical protein
MDLLGAEQLVPPIPRICMDATGGFFDDPIAGWGNDDLLLRPETRDEFARKMPEEFRVFDWPELRTLFEEHDHLANAARRDTRRGGVFAIGVGFAGIVVTALASLVANNIALALAGSLLVVGAGLVGFHFLLTGKRRLVWITNRYWTERIRQFYFQFIINNAELAAQAMVDDQALALYVALRRETFRTFVDEHADHSPLSMERMKADVAEISPWLHPDWENRPPPAKQTLSLDRMLVVLAKQRLRIQDDYVTRKLLKSYKSPEWRLGVVMVLSDILTVLTLLLTASIGVIFALSGGDDTIAIKSMLALNAIFGGGVLALRALESGLQLAADTDRYSWYLASTKSLIDRYKQRLGADDRIELLRQMEHLSYQELRRFTISSLASRYLI